MRRQKFDDADHVPAFILDLRHRLDPSTLSSVYQAYTDRFDQLIPGNREHCAT
jgi:hypothetical protein